METAPAPLLSAASPIVNSAVPAESIDSSPRSRHTESWDADSVSLKQHKLRLMCSYGGHIVPRPHDKTLFYAGGDTRIVVIDRHISLSELHLRLSKTLPNNQAFTLKYQLPNEDLDSLISVSTDEDFENMVEECDRLSNGSGVVNNGRLRLFLFPKSPSNIEQLLETSSGKTDEWFFNALNGKTNTLSGGASDRDFSETSSINNLLGLDDEPVGKSGIGGKDGEAQGDVSKFSGNGGAVNQDVHSIPDSQMFDTSSSFGSTSSSPSMANLKPIKVRVEENPKIGGVSGMEDHFRQIKMAGGGTANLIVPQKHQEEVRVFVAPAVANALPVVVGGEYAANRVFPDDNISDHGGYIKVPLQAHAQLSQQPVTQKAVSVTDLPSPDSYSSEGSSRNPMPRHFQALNQAPNAQIQTGNSRVTPNQTDIKNGDTFQGQSQVQEHGYILHGQYDQNHPSLHHPQQFVHAGNPYFPTGAMPIASYYPVYASHQQHQPLLEQQYPFYFMRPTQAYNLQPPYTEIAQPTPPNSLEMHPSAGVAHHTGPTKTKLPSKVSRKSSVPTPQLSSGHHQSQYVGVNQIPLPEAPGNAHFTYEFADPAHHQMYYTQPLPPQMTTHYQTLTTPTQIPNASAQLPAAPQP